MSLAELTLPSSLNSAVPVSRLPQGYTTELSNVMMRELPSRMRPRNGMRVVAAWGSLGEDIWPYWATESADNLRLMIGAAKITVDDDGTEKKRAWSFYYPRYIVARRQYLGITTQAVTEVEQKMVTVDFEKNQLSKLGAPSTEQVEQDYQRVMVLPLSSQVMPWGSPIKMDNSVLFTTAGDEFSAHRKWKNPTKNMAHMDWSCVFAWGGQWHWTSPAIGAQQNADTTLIATNIGTTFKATDVTVPNSDPLHKDNGDKTGTIVYYGGGNNRYYDYTYWFQNNTPYGNPQYQLDRAWGWGAPADPTDPDQFGNALEVMGSPGGCVSLAQYKGRCFAARGVISSSNATASSAGGGTNADNYPSRVGDFAGYAGNALIWSKPGNWNDWRDQDYALVDNDSSDPITALAALSDVLYIFKANKTFALTGNDEDSFAIQNISGVVGCPYPNGITVYENTLFFAAADGVYSLSGAGELTNITAPDPSTGIAKLWARQPWSVATGRPILRTAPIEPTSMYQYYWPTLAVTPDGTLLVAVQDLYNELTQNFAYDIMNGTWSQWGAQDPANNPIRVVQMSRGRVLGIHRQYVTDLTDLFNSEGLETGFYDEYVTGDPSQTEELQFPKSPIVVDAQMYLATPGNTTRLRELQIDHNVYSTSGGEATWEFSFSRDAHLHDDSVGETHTLTAAAGDSLETDLHHDRFAERYQREGTQIGIKMHLETDVTEAVKDYSIYAAYAEIETTRTMSTT